MDKRYLTVQEASDYLSISRWSLYKLVQRRLVPFIPLTIKETSDNQVQGKALIRFDIAALNQWMTKRMIRPLNVNSKEALSSTI